MKVLQIYLKKKKTTSNDLMLLLHEKPEDH